jgi:hypothetical protein
MRTKVGCEKKAYNRARRLWNKQGNSSKVTAEIPAARSVEEVLTGGGFSAAVSRQPEADSLRQLEREKKEKENPELRGLVCGRDSLEGGNSTRA